MPFLTTTSTWATNLQIGLDSKQYVVQLKRAIGCCHEDYQIFVNGKQMENHGLTYNPCSPLCCPGGSFEWEQDGHHFHIIFNRLSNRRYGENFRLFVDGIDADTGLEFTAFWRRRAILVLVIGLIFLLLAAVFCVLLFAVFKVKYYYGLGGAITFLVLGAMYVTFAMIMFVRYSQTRSYPSSFSNSPDYHVFKNV